MTEKDYWWAKPREIFVVVDNQSWILPYAEKLVEEINCNDDHARLVRKHSDITQGDIAFYLGCTQITPKNILSKNRRNLVVHESDLPQGKGFSPLFWQILEGNNIVPVCLIEATNELDSGPIILEDKLCFEGHELNNEIRHAQGFITISLCLRFLAQPAPLTGHPQQGPSSQYTRRRPQDSKLDPQLTIEEQFPLLRIVDNTHYPAFFELNGYRYDLKISKSEKGK